MNFPVSSTAKHDIYNLLIGLVAPRPIALVTSMDVEGGLNAAPFSSYNYVCVDPPVIALGVANKPGPVILGKDTAQNIRNTKDFVVNVVSESMAEKMNICAIDFPPGVNELEKAGFTTTASQTIAVPRISEAPAALECRELMTMEIGNSRVILGQVLSMYVQDEFLDPQGPYIRSEDLHAIGRMNGLGSYVKTRDAFFHIPRKTYKEWLQPHPPKS